MGGVAPGVSPLTVLAFVVSSQRRESSRRPGVLRMLSLQTLRATGGARPRRPARRPRRARTRAECAQVLSVQIRRLLCQRRHDTVERLHRCGVVSDLLNELRRPPEKRFKSPAEVLTEANLASNRSRDGHEVLYVMSLTSVAANVVSLGLLPVIRRLRNQSGTADERLTELRASANRCVPHDGCIPHD